MFTKKGHICNHPEMPNYNSTTGEKNEPCEVNTCECGQNYICPKCGWGSVGLPHTCKVIEDKRHC